MGLHGSKEKSFRDALHSVGLESHAAKLPLAPSSLKAPPLPEPNCLSGVVQHIAKSSPFVGLQVLPAHPPCLSNVKFYVLTLNLSFFEV